jgi:hypothetical protein
MPFRRVKTKSPSVDCRGHVLTVFDGADRVGSLVESGGKFHAYDLRGALVGIFAEMLRAARAPERVR